VSGTEVVTQPPPNSAGSSAAANPAAIPDDPRGSFIPPWRVISAKFMELRRRQGLLIAVFILAVGIEVVIDAIFLILHGVDPKSYKPAGGLSKFRAFCFVFVETFGISGILVGAAAGSSDLSDGVFRHLVVTGRSRIALFIARIPAGLLILFPITALGYAIEAFIAALAAPKGNLISVNIGSAATTAPAAGPHLHGIAVTVLSDTPSIHLLVITGLWLMLQVLVAFVLGLGLGALTGSRYVSVAILIAMQLIVTPLLGGVTIPHLVNAQRAWIGVAFLQLEPSALTSFTGGGGGNGNLLGIAPMPTFALPIVIISWIVVALGLGGWRMTRRDA
jgi:hypothetical protein